MLKSFAVVLFAAASIATPAVFASNQDPAPAAQEPAPQPDAKPDSAPAAQNPPPTGKPRLTARPKPDPNAVTNAKPRNAKDEAAAKKLAERKSAEDKRRDEARREAAAKQLRPGMEVELSQSERAKLPPPSTPGVRKPKTLTTSPEYDQAITFHGERVRTGVKDQKIKSVRALALTNDSRALPILVAALKDADADVRSVAAEGLGQLGVEECAAPLAATLAGDSDAGVRSAAGDALGSFNAKQGVAYLTAASKDSSADVRASVAEALSSYSSEEATVALLSMLGDSVPTVRDAAAESLG